MLLANGDVRRPEARDEQGPPFKIANSSAMTVRLAGG
jgi:hypothetical protein